MIAPAVRGGMKNERRGTSNGCFDSVGTVSSVGAGAPDPGRRHQQRYCRSLFIGFESISPASIGSVHKRQNRIGEYEEAVWAIHSRGIMINASFVFGLDGDTPDTFRATLDWIVKNRIETVTSHILTPYPGTVLYDRMKADGRILTDDLSQYNTAYVVFRPKGMTPEELYRGYLWMYRQVYSLKNIIRRRPAAKQQRATFWLFNLLYRKYGRFTDGLCRLITYERIGRLAQRLGHYRSRRNGFLRKAV